MVKEAQKSYNPQALEQRIQEFWEETDAYHKTKEHRKDGEDFYFIDGPPYTTGHIHLGTAWNKTFKDVKIRYLRHLGHNVRDQPGFDMHGLPIEVKVEKELGIKNKQEIEARGIDMFVEKCQEFALRFQKSMAEEFKGLGVWLDWDNPYFTIRNSYIEGAWWTLKQASEKKLLEESQRVLNWCSRCQTALAEAEVEYWDETDPSVYVKFPLKDKENEYILIWTTTPWTLPSNLAVAVHPDFTYAKVLYRTESGEEDIIYLVEERAAEIGKLGRYAEMEILERFQGSDLAGLQYQHPLAELVPFQQDQSQYPSMHRVLVANFVTADMTGIVHVAPGHGPDDFDLGQEYGLPPFCPVDEKGEFDDKVPGFKGRYIKDVDPDIMEYLNRKGLLLKSGKITHRYGHCWRCNKPITHRATTQWFLRVSRLSEEMLAEIKRIKWVPKWAGSSRFYDWVKNTRDWCISRQRYWGIPLPVWRCEEKDCGAMKVISSQDDLVGAQGYQEGMNLHRPWIDKVHFDCPDCGNTMTRLPDVLDVWFDSAVSSWAQLGYPRNKEAFERWWPCKWITEAHDQTRGWFYSQLGASMVAFGKSPYDSVLMHGFALDDKGKAMSKSAGNNIEPITVTSLHGIDSLRFYLLVTSPPWDDLPFNMKEVENAKRTLNILWNVYVFSTTYMELDGFDPDSVSYKDVKADLQVEDRWCLSRLEQVKKAMTQNMEGEMHHKALREVKGFILNDLSRWYVKLVRDRSWTKEQEGSKIAAYFTLHHCLSTLATIMSPVTPHISEEMYQNLVGRYPTVSMEDWPEVHEDRIDTGLEEDMATIQQLVDTVMSMRQKAEVNLRWPVTELVIRDREGKAKAALERLEQIFKEQVNTKSITLITGEKDWDKLLLTAAPNFGKLGPVFKGEAGKAAALIKGMSPQELKEGLEAGVLQINGQPITEEMVNFGVTIPEGYTQEELPWATLYLNTQMTPETLSEGFSRELIRRIQDMRREKDLPMEKKVDCQLELDPELAELVSPRLEHMATETRTTLSLESPSAGFIKEWKVKDRTVVIGLGD